MDMFGPNLTLTREPDGEFTLHSATLTPHGSYLAGPAQVGVPATIRLTEEVLPVLLHLNVQTAALCLPGLKAIKHSLRNIKLGPAHNKTKLMAFVMLGDAIVGSRQVNASSFVPVPSAGGIIETSDWFAWVTETIHGQRSFHIVGTVVLPTPGFQVGLETAAARSINPKELSLKLQVTPRPGIWPQHVTSVHVHYDRVPYEEQYTGVLVTLPSNEGVRFPMQVLS
jgi:hypothetical protein